MKAVEDSVDDHSSKMDVLDVEGCVMRSDK